MRAATCMAAGASFLQRPFSAIAIAATLAAASWPASHAEAACAPAAVGSTPSNSIITCNLATSNQNNPDGYGTGAQNNNTVNVLTGASVTGTNSGFKLGNRD